MSWMKVASGLYASHPSEVEGPVRVVAGLQEIVSLMREPEGEPLIIVTNVAGGSAVSTIIRRAKAIVSTIGGPNSHIVVVARDYNMPCIVGAAELDLASLSNGVHVRLELDGGISIRRSEGVGPSDEEVRLLRQVAFAGALASKADVIGFEAATLDKALERLVDSGLIEGGELIVPTPAGSEALETWYAEDREKFSDNEQARLLKEFRPFDKELKRLASAWQNAEMNGDWDAKLSTIEDLQALHKSAAALIEHYAKRLPRLIYYKDTLGLAHDKILSGDGEYFVGVTVASYHTMWFHLHEDILRILQRERDPE